MRRGQRRAALRDGREHRSCVCVWCALRVSAFPVSDLNLTQSKAWTWTFRACFHSSPVKTNQATALTGQQPRARVRAYVRGAQKSPLASLACSSSGLELCLGLLMSSSRRAAGSGSSSEAAQVRPARTSEQRSPLVSAGDVPSSATAGAAYFAHSCAVCSFSRARTCGC